ncbi:hypothetical protein [Ulvibacter litoralis]|nr:hypothetical protein [Ulvibacter litoralis]
MLKTVSFCFFLMFSFSYGQKVVEKSLDASGLERILISSKTISRISIVSEKTDKITILTKISGETYENLVVTTSEENKTLILDTSYIPFFTAENDKLAAHKVISIEMTVIVPEFFSIAINSEIASVKASGSFDLLSITLRGGNCLVQDFIGNARIKTQKGAITVYTNSTVSGTANSVKGRVENELVSNGMYRIIAESRSGAIGLFQTK